jgi:hypothetical protein
MSWTIHEKKTSKEEFDFPVVKVSSKVGLVLDKGFTKQLDPDFKKVVVMTDKEMKKIGLWFFRDATLPKEYRRDAYFLIKGEDASRNSWTVNCKTLVKQNWVIGCLDDTGHGAFTVSSGSMENGNDFYVVDLVKMV